MEKVLASPAVAKYLKKQMDDDNLWHTLEKNGATGSIQLPTGTIVDYKYDPQTKMVGARLRVDWLLEKATLEECANLRKDERKGNAAHGINGGLFKVTPYLDTELRARGLDIYTEDDAEMRKIMYTVQTEFPKYLTTERRII